MPAQALVITLVNWNTDFLEGLSYLLRRPELTKKLEEKKLIKAHHQI